ncbi:hypothetical protein EDD11_010427 [Mortierella claussenii]|nr:hypothetical protein EDD11_010427 [Mortierella claussenii]
MAQHHTSPYHDVKHVQMIVSPLFKVPTPRYHDFALEHRIVQEYQRIMAEEAAVMDARENAYRLYAEERQARLKHERISRARKIAPGFLDNEDRRILTPTLATTQTKEQQQQAQESRAGRNYFDYSEFEASDNGPVDVDKSGSSNHNDGTSRSGGMQGDASTEQGEKTNVQRGFSSSPDPTTLPEPSGENTEEEVIVQAVPLSELTGMLRDSCLEEDSSSPSPRPWTTERDVVSEKSSLPPFNATRLDFREFEQGLGPPDPWDTPVDDMTALKDVIAQQMGHSSTALNENTQLPQQQTQQQTQQNLHTYPYQQPPQPQQQQAVSPFLQAVDLQSHNQSPYGTTPNRAGYNSSPIPVPAFIPPPKLTGIAQQQQALQYHQQQHRHSTGGMGAPTVGLNAAQQHARFANASPSPPPLPPPPPSRAKTTSPSIATGATPGSAVVSRPPIPARPHRPGDPTSVDSPVTSNAGGDHVTILDRSMTPPRPPLPPPPLLSSSSAVGAGAANAGSAPSASTGAQQGLGTGAGVSGSIGGPPALKPRPPKDHEMLHGILERNKTPASAVGRGSGRGLGADIGPASSSSSPSRDGIGLENESQQHQHQQVVAAPPNANSLIDQLVNMGFTREQSHSALEKYDYDLEKATNHLLDWDE